MIWRRLTAFGKLVIFWVVMWLSESVTVRTPQCRLQDKHGKSI